MVENLLEKLDRLLPEQQQQVLDFIEFLLFQHERSIEQSTSAKVVSETPKPRVFGQYRGRIWMSEDFNDPLPDEFWLGES